MDGVTCNTILRTPKTEAGRTPVSILQINAPTCPSTEYWALSLFCGLVFPLLFGKGPPSWQAFFCTFYHVNRFPYMGLSRSCVSEVQLSKSGVVMWSYRLPRRYHRVKKNRHNTKRRQTNDRLMTNLYLYDTMQSWIYCMSRVGRNVFSSHVMHTISKPPLSLYPLKICKFAMSVIYHR